LQKKESVKKTNNYNMTEDFKKLEKLSKDNQHLNQEILEHLKVIRRRMFFTQLIAWIKLALIATPIVLLLLWLPPRAKLVWDDYKQFRGEFEVILKSANNPLLLLQEFLTE